MAVNLRIKFYLLYSSHLYSTVAAWQAASQGLPKPVGILQQQQVGSTDIARPLIPQSIPFASDICQQPTIFNTCNKS